MMAGIRSARAPDLDALVGIENAAFTSDRLSRRSLRRLLSSPSAAVLVAEETGLPVGYAVVLYRRRSGVARLYSLAVAPDRSHAGLGRGLLDAAEEAARKAGKPTMRLEVREGNGRAILLYEGSGYRRIGRRHHYYGDGATALRLEKTLDGQASSAGSPPKGAGAAVGGGGTAR